MLGTSSSSVPRTCREYLLSTEESSEDHLHVFRSKPLVGTCMSPVELEYIWASLPVKFPLKEKSAYAQEKCLETETTRKQLETTADLCQNYCYPKSEG